MSSYRPGFCFEEPFSKRKAWISPEIMFDPQIFLFPPKREVKKREKFSTNAFCKQLAPKQREEDKQGQERKISDKSIHLSTK